ncbi:UDP-N-acetylmuramate dehydrogenase [uncultured Bacteroides sp.]|uniref:UDP-N-acetylmuramate dehydrogenase n=1 Tax=uncultured Bacteroides sp. TaxID=162156 RepID=UPI002AAB765C|nr:UDP-N-acetylmuramate dehydrogenase [uncultured Bacteroides sp.]
MITIEKQYSLLSHNTFGFNVKTDTFIEYSSTDDLKQILCDKELLNGPYLHIGSGSNLLFTSDYKGTILHSKIQGIEVTENTNDYVLVKVGAGVEWDNFVAHCVSQGWAGVENLSLIPGEVGASAVQNIGAYGVEAKDLITQVDAVEIATAKECVFSNAECNYSYRQSIFKSELKNKFIVTYVTYKLSKNAAFNLEYGNIKAELEKYPEISLATIRQAIIAIRDSKLPDPKIEGNAGSFFMNPIIPRSQFMELQKQFPGIPFYDIDEDRVKVPAGWMIDKCGWKGKTLGHVGVHSKQALVLVNKGNATGDEIVNLSREIQASVKKLFNIEIHPEVNFIS